MKIALISDIHGNSVALMKVLEQVKQEGVTQLFIMGDFIGYYYNHDKVFELLSEFRWIGVQGNHDAMLAEFLVGNEDAMEKYRSLYGSSLDIALRVLKKNQIEMLISLPPKRECNIDGKKIILCHGTPWKQNLYVYLNSEPELFNRLFGLGYDFIILGHTHYPMIKRRRGVTIINPGSIGQPRDEGSKASWALADFSTGEIMLRKTPFPPDKIIKEVDTHDPDKTSFKNVLLRKGAHHSKNL